MFVYDIRMSLAFIAVSRCAGLLWRKKAERFLTGSSGLVRLYNDGIHLNFDRRFNFLSGDYFPNICVFNRYCLFGTDRGKCM